MCIRDRQQEFVADVSHELRTPLTAVKSYVETLLDGAAADPAVSNRFLNVLKRETDRMVDLVKDLLELSQLDYSQVELHKTKVELIDLAADVVEQSQQKIGLKRPKIEIAIPPGLPPVWVDREKIMRVFLNLLNNAIKYTPSDGKITISASIEMCIRDRGSTGRSTGNHLHFEVRRSDGSGVWGHWYKNPAVNPLSFFSP